MKKTLKLLGKLALFILPVLLYLCVFILFEPYNYFGIKKGEFNTNQPIYRVRAYQQSPTNAILLGDSRMAHLDGTLVNSLSGKSFSNLAFGGAAQKEITDLFWFAADHNPNLDTVFLEVSFYTINNQYQKDRVGNIKTISQNPFAYIFNFDYNLEMLNNMKLVLSGEPVDFTAKETATYAEKDYLDENGNPLAYRKQLTAYAQTIYQNLSSYDVSKVLLSDTYDVMTSPDRMQDRTWQLNQAELDRLLEVAQYCKDNGIALTFVLPPIDDSITEMCLKPLGIDKEMQEVVATLKSTGATVLDFEITGKAPLDEAQFFDGFHIDTEYGLDEYTKLLFKK